MGFSDSVAPNRGCCRAPDRRHDSCGGAGLGMRGYRASQGLNLAPLDQVGAGCTAYPPATTTHPLPFHHPHQYPGVAYFTPQLPHAQEAPQEVPQQPLPQIGAAAASRTQEREASTHAHTPELAQPPALHRSARERVSPCGSVHKLAPQQSAATAPASQKAAATTPLQTLGL